MGIFGSRKKIYVSSSIYNMAGGYDERTNYLKYLVLNGVLSDNGKSVADVITSGTLNGPRMNYQSFFRWAKNNYPEGMPLGGLFGSSPLDVDIVAPHITVPSGSVADVETAILDFADYDQWAEAYMEENYPDLMYTDWGADIDEDTYLITITFEDTTTTSFTPTGYNPAGTYIYARYSEVIPPVDPDPVFVSAGNDLGPYELESSLPSTTGYYLASEIDEFNVNQDRHNIVRVVKTYSDGRPSVESESSTVIGSRLYDRLVQTFERYTNLRADLVDDDRSWWDVSRIVIWEAPAYETNLIDEDTVVTEIEPGVFETEVTSEYEEVFLSGSDWWAREELWEKDNGYRSPAKLFTYKIGDGIIELDELESTTVPMDGYFPMIPIRTNNKMIDEEPHLTNIYPQAAKAWRRASGNKKITKLIDDVKDNPDLSDIDYAFVIWGVPLNTITREGKLYLYLFFKEMMLQQTADEAAFSAYLDQEAAWSDYLEALEAYQNSGDDTGQTEPPVAPVKPPYANPQSTTVRTNGQHTETQHYDFRLTWNAITEVIVPGKWKIDAEKNDVKIEKLTQISVSSGFMGKATDNLKTFDKTYERFSITWQENDTQYRVLTIIGATHKNVVYGGKSVDITSTEALDDGDDSGFIVPLHLSTLKSMPIVWANQLSLEGMLIVFNCYVIVKKPWYATFLGMLVIGLLTMGAGAIFSGGASVLGGVGILGSNVAVGAMFGMTGLAGALAGAAINSIIMTTILAVVQEVAANMGALGAIFSAIIGIVMGAVVAGNISGQAFSFDVFLRADNLLKLTNATLSAYSIHVQGKTADIYSQMTDLEEDYKKQKREIDELMYELTGFSSGFDPTVLTEVLLNAQENRDAFNQRTLMTGSDLAELTHSLIGSFVDASLDLENLRG